MAGKFRSGLLGPLPCSFSRKAATSSRVRGSGDKQVDRFGAPIAALCGPRATHVRSSPKGVPDGIPSRGSSQRWRGGWRRADRSANLFRQLDDDPLGAADIAESVAVLVAPQLADELCAAGSGRARTASMSSTANATWRMPEAFAGARW